MKTIADHILDITENSISAGASRVEIKVYQSNKENYYQLIFIDNGKGMDKETVNRVIDPFYTSRTTRKVGMGIPLFKQNAEITGGSFVIQSKLGEGTLVQANFVLDSIDLIPQGDIADAIVFLSATTPKVEFEFEYTTDKANYVFDTIEVKKVLGGVPMSNPEIRQYLKEMIDENINEIK